MSSLLKTLLYAMLFEFVRSVLVVLFKRPGVSFSMAQLFGESLCCYAGGGKETNYDGFRNVELCTCVSDDHDPKYNFPLILIHVRTVGGITP